MLKICTLVFCFSFGLVQAQNSAFHFFEVEQDSIKKNFFLKQLGNGYFPTKYFDFDLRYLVKYNQYEGLRTGLGGVTNKNLSEKFKINGYTVYGFRDDAYKYSVGGSIRLSQSTNTWLNLSYTDDLQETGSSKFLTDTRFFQFFEPRLLNIDLFHRHITQAISINHQLHPKLSTVAQFSVSNVEPTYNYLFNLNNTLYDKFQFSTATLSAQWSPFSQFRIVDNLYENIKEGYPKFTLQYTRSVKNVLKGDFNFSKLDFKTIHRHLHKNKNVSEITLVSGMARGDVPLTHLYHAYPNNITKETILQRFSVAGITSFETMYFNEFFSDKFTTLQFKHFLRPFNISQRYKPQLVLISRFAIGDMNNPERHENVTFGSLRKGYTESGFEINKLLFGFGLSFTYRYGGYHLPNFEDNIAFKFTFNLTL
ncbi:hypothetical protein CLV33_1034 [Jejuia pallidilutea]|uniref:Outer membrane protein n=1 Tax=Jejuia pallidilutea TaxID=504487 RepID=A0A362X1Q4_9FLAO|nr:hypothetical protein [Jejuia pallidilutea]PQV49375.1 hypothetical protein CLV33_1034 [Jejuia pallidilutea]